MILPKNWKFLSPFFLGKRGLLKVLGFCFIKQRSITKLQKCRCLNVEKWMFSKEVKPWFWVKIGNFEILCVWEKKRSRKSVWFICHMEKKHFLSINYRFFSGRKIGIFRWG